VDRELGQSKLFKTLKGVVAERIPNDGMTGMTGGRECLFLFTWQRASTKCETSRDSLLEQRIDV
jgi:hypothetical protein